MERMPIGAVLSLTVQVSVYINDHPIHNVMEISQFL